MRIWLDPEDGLPGRDAEGVRGAGRQQLHTAAGEVRATSPRSASMPTSLESRRRSGNSWSRRAATRWSGSATSPRSSSGRERQFDVGVRWPQGGVHRHPCHAEANPLTVINGVRAIPEHQAQMPAGLSANIAYDATEFIAPRSTRCEDPHRGGCDRHRGDFPVPRQHPFDVHSDRHHSLVAHRRDDRADGARLFDQSTDAARTGAGDRPRRR